MRTLGLVTLSTVALVGCGGGDDLGDLDLVATFEGLSCFDAGVRLIEIDVVGTGYGDQVSDTITCAGSEGRFVVTGLLPDVYEVRIAGFDPSGLRLYEGVFDVGVRSDQTSVVTLDAPVTRGDLTLYWTFESSESCGDVFEVGVVLYDPFDRIYDDAAYDCTFGGVTYDAVVTGEWIVEMEGYGAGGRTVYRSGATGLTVRPDRQNAFEVDLSRVSP